MKHKNTLLSRLLFFIVRNECAQLQIEMIENLENTEPGKHLNEIL